MDRFQIKDMNIILMLKMIGDILYVIIYGIREFRWLKDGKISNIKIPKKLKKEKILLRQCIKLMMERRYQIKNIIMILLL